MKWLIAAFFGKLFNWLISKGADGEGDGGGEEGDAARRPLTRRLHSGLSSEQQDSVPDP
jgi:hypothetical protein